MRTTTALSFLVLSLVTTLPAPLFAGQENAPPAREKILLDADWRFRQSVPETLRDAVPVTAWRWQTATGNAQEQEQKAASVPDDAGADWKNAAIGQDVFESRRGVALFQARLPQIAGPGRTVQFRAVDDNAVVFLNGVKLLRHEGWNDPFDVSLDSAWRDSGPNVLTVLVENNNGAGGITGNVNVGLRQNPETTPFSDPHVNDRAWRVVRLPHDYVIEGAFTPTGDASHGSLIPSGAWYRKTFILPASDKGKALWLDFDGVYRDSVVYLNGKELGRHPCGYTPFSYDISEAANYGGSNVLAIQVNAQKQEGWWYEGGGIYRHVWLHKADPVHVAPWGTFVRASLPEPKAGQPVAPATVTVQTTVAAPSAAAGYRIVSHVLNKAGKVVGNAAVSSLSLPSGQTTVTQQITVDRPELWSIEAPTLYRLHTEVIQGDRVVDTTDMPFGIRTIRFDAEKGFFLNGKSVKIKGTCNHQDFIGVGVAMPDSVLTWRLQKLKAMGSNAYRTAHNPPTRELLDACDRLGMLVMDENRHLGDTEDGKASPTTPYADLREVESMVLRDRNHPSVILWSMCNEEPIQGSKHGAGIFRAMKAAVDKLDGTRPVTCAMNGGYDRPEGITGVTDLQGINYNPGAYDNFHKQFPNIPLYGSETASAVGARGNYEWTKFDRFYGDPQNSYVNAYDVNAPSWAQTAQQAWGMIAARDFVAGGFVWTGFDYKGEPTPFVWPAVNSNFGVLDMCGFPKDTYWYYLAWWGDKPVVHLLPHWNWTGRDGQTVRVWAYGNGDRVELLLNGKSVGTQTMPRWGHVEWAVPYAPGTLEARSYQNGKLIATDKVETTGPPAGLRLTTDRTRLTADSEDITMVAVEVIDGKGRVVPTASDTVSFALTGPGMIAGVGSGDPNSHEPDKASTRSAFHGRCMVLVGATDQKGSLSLTATAPGLKSATLTLQSASLQAPKLAR